MPGVEVEAAVLDASIAVRWVVPEQGGEAATALLTQRLTWYAPRLMFVEVASALRRKVELGELRPEAAASDLGALLDTVKSGLVRLVDDEQYAAEALLLALRLSHKLPDCLYLAIAEREGAALATADMKLAALARDRHVPVIGAAARASRA